MAASGNLLWTLIANGGAVSMATMDMVADGLHGKSASHQSLNLKQEQEQCMTGQLFATELQLLKMALAVIKAVSCKEMESA